MFSPGCDLRTARGLRRVVCCPVHGPAGCTSGFQDSGRSEEAGSPGPAERATAENQGGRPSKPRSRKQPRARRVSNSLNSQTRIAGTAERGEAERAGFVLTNEQVTAGTWVSSTHAGAPSRTERRVSQPSGRAIIGGKSGMVGFFPGHPASRRRHKPTSDMHMRHGGAARIILFNR